MASNDRDQSVSQFKSPNPELSRLCLALAMVEATLLLLAYCLRDSHAVYIFYTVKTFGLLVSVVLFMFHETLRSQVRKHLSRSYNSRGTRLPAPLSASPLLAGLTSVCGLAALSILLDANYFFKYKAEMFFWAGYWAEWWTGHVGAWLEAYGC